MCSTLASSSSWQVLCRCGTLPRAPAPPGPPPHTQLRGVLPSVHSRMLWLALPPGVPAGAAPADPPPGPSRLSAPGSDSTSRCRVAQPRRWREKAAGSGGLRQAHSGGKGPVGKAGAEWAAGPEALAFAAGHVTVSACTAAP